MNVVFGIARVALGGIFLVFGLNGFFNFLRLPQPDGAAGQFLGVLFTSHYLAVVFALQLLAGLALVTDYFVPLSLLVLGAIIFNIILFHVTLAPKGIEKGLLVLLLWCVTFCQHWSRFRPLFQIH